MLLQLKQDVDYLKQVVAKAGLSSASAQLPVIAAPDIKEVNDLGDWQPSMPEPGAEDPEEQSIEESETNLSLEASNLDLIAKVLKKHGGNRKEAAEELGISERTLYRKLKMIKQ
jgi:transcriptional regulator with PAS, ATPase and Fis domain